MEYNKNRDIADCGIIAIQMEIKKLSARFPNLLLKLYTYYFPFENCWHKDMILYFSIGISNNESGIDQKLKQKIVSDIITPE